MHPLHTALRSHDTGTRDAAVRAVVAGVFASRPGEERAALAQLEELGPAAHPAVPGLLDWTNDPDLERRRWADRLVRRIGGAALPHLKDHLADPDWRRRGAVARAAMVLRPVAEGAIALLMHLVGDENTWVAETAAAGLIRLVPPEAEILLRVAHDPTSPVRALAVRGLLTPAIGRRIDELAEAIRPLADDPASDVRAAAALVIGATGWAAPWAREALRRQMQDHDPGVRSAVASTLRPHAGSVPAPADDGAPRDEETPDAPGLSGHPLLAALLALHDDPDAAVRAAAIESTAWWWSVRIDPAPLVLRHRSDPAPEVRMAVAVALIAQTPRIVAQLPALIDLLDDPVPSVRAAVADCLGGMRLPARPALPRLAARLADADASVRRSAVAAIHRVEPDPGVLLSLLLPLRTDPAGPVRSATLEALGHLRKATRPHLPAVMAHLEDPDPDVRLTAVWAVRQIVWDVPPVLETQLQAVEAAIPRVEPWFWYRIDGGG